MLMKFVVNDMYRSETGSVIPNPPSFAGRRMRKYAAVGVSAVSYKSSSGIWIKDARASMIVVLRSCEIVPVPLGGCIAS